MRDEDGGDTKTALQRFQFLPHLHAQLGVKVRERLIEQQHLWLNGQRARKCDALLLAAGKLVGPPLGVIGEPHKRQHIAHLSGDISARQFALFQAKGDILFHRHVRPQRVILEHHADVALPRRNTRDVAAIDMDLTALREIETGDQS